MPREQQEQMRSLIRAAWELDAKDGMMRLRKLAEWLREAYPDAAGSLLGRNGGMFHDQSLESSSLLASLPGDDELD